MSVEDRRLDEHRSGETDWMQWGPYLSERAWGTVREDYSANGEAWDAFPHDHARSRAYRWNEDGLLGFSDRSQYLCFALALWNGRDPILKERFFGLTGREGNHAEDVKEYYFYLDATPTHSYLKALYKYPQRTYPYHKLLGENLRRGYHDFEYELLDTGVFDENRYFDVQIEYIKAAHDDMLIQISVTNRGPDTAPLTLLPTLWFRNTWSWGYPDGPMLDVPERPCLHAEDDAALRAEHPTLGTLRLYAQNPDEWLFTENETNFERLFGQPNGSRYVKDAFHRYIIHGEADAVNPAGIGTKAAAVFRRDIAPGATETIRLRLCAGTKQRPFTAFERTAAARRSEADTFYDTLQADALTDDARSIQRQALAGMIWTKQLYYYDIHQWLAGDPAFPPPPESRKSGRNSGWKHLNNFDIVSMPDKWEYPWYAVWDSAFHCIPLAMVDVEFAKDQLLLFTREWYMHPNGQLPAYEWAFGDVNPPVHAWAAMEIYRRDWSITGQPDTDFLKRIFHKMLLNFTWWVNRKDADENNIFQGGFLGLDNISLFDRSKPLPGGGYLNQSDGTAWMGFYALVMMDTAIELARFDHAYEDLAVKFYEHFLDIAVAMSGNVRDGLGLWDDEDGFYYDALRLPDGRLVPLKVRSLVGLMPLIAVETIGQQTLDTLPELARSLAWVKTHRPGFTENLASADVTGYGTAHLFSIPTEEQLIRVLRYMLDEDEFLSPYGIRSVSKFHENRPFSVNINGQTFSVAYEPAESTSGLFGGNSNWRGPIWFPINYLLIEALRRYHRYYGDELRVECPTGSGEWMTLDAIADDLSHRLTRLFLRDDANGGRRPVYGGTESFQQDPHWRDHVLFFEYFHGDNGAGLGASHQTGWTGLVAILLQQLHGG